MRGRFKFHIPALYFALAFVDEKSFRFYKKFLITKCIIESVGCIKPLKLQLASLSKTVRANGAMSKKNEDAKKN
jgi:hypothetical protein